MWSQKCLLTWWTWGRYESWHTDLGERRFSCRGSWNLYTWGEGRVQSPVEMDCSKKDSKETQAAHGCREEWPFPSDFWISVQIVLTCCLLPKPDLGCLQESRWNHRTSPLGHSPALGAAPPDAAQVQSNPRSSVDYPSWKWGQNDSGNSTELSCPAVPIL